MTDPSVMLSEAVALSEAGDTFAARTKLQEVIQIEPRNETAWLRYVDTFTEDAARLDALEDFLLACPQSQQGLMLMAETRRRMLAGEAGAVAPAAPQTPVVQRVAPAARKSAASRRSPLAVIALCMACIAATAVLALAGWFQGKVEALQAQNIVWLEKSALLSAQYEQMTTASLALMNQRDAFQSQLEELSNRHTRLQLDYIKLVEDFNGLSQRHSQLIGDYNGLVEKYNRQVADYNQLTEERYELAEENAYFKTVAIIPPYIYIYQREVYLTFETTQGELVTWVFPFENLEEDIRRGYLSRENPLNEILDIVTVTDPNTGKTYRLLDLRKYVDATPFYGYIEEIYRESASDEDFIHEVWNIVAQLSTYSYELEETPRYPLETFLAGGGDCEDTAILFASMILAAPVNWQVGLFYMDGNNPNSLETVNHVAVWVNTGRSDHIVETTSKTIREPFEDPYGWKFPLK
jgi:hypothetical protein